MTSIRSKSVILLTALALHAAAQMPERRDSTVLDNGYETTDSMSIIEWHPPYLEWERIEDEHAGIRSDSSSVVIRIPPPRRLLPDEIFTIWRLSITNGSMGNWGMPYPAGYLDARTLSFPSP